jgi:hypothetical protein
MGLDHFLSLSLSGGAPPADVQKTVEKQTGKKSISDEEAEKMNGLKDLEREMYCSANFGTSGSQQEEGGGNEDSHV